MSKQSGLGMNAYVGGFDLSGDIGALDKVSGSLGLLDVTPLNKSAHVRLTGLRDGGIDFTSYFDNAAGAEHPALSGLPRSDVGAMVMVNPLALGSPAACCVAKQVNYDPSRGHDGSLTLKVQLQANGYGLEWAEQLTPGLRTDTSATNGATQDDGGGFSTPSVPASTVAATNTSPLPASVVVSGGTVSAVTVNGSQAGTGDGTYTVSAGGTISVTYTVAPTWAWTLQTAFGAQAYLQVTAFTGTDVTVTVQHSADNSSWSTLAAFAQTTAAATFQRVTVSNTTTVNRYLRAITTTSGGFTSATFGVALNRNLVAGVVF